MSELTGSVWDVLDTERDVVRAGIDALETLTDWPDLGTPAGVWREIFQQAEAVFGGADVPRAEFAAWLHFAATTLGQDTYAEELAAAEPAMPWRALWAWWRPCGARLAHPNLSYASVKRYEREGREVLYVQGTFEDTWLDLETGVRMPAPDPEGPQPVEIPHVRADNEAYLGTYTLSAPESFGYADPLTGPDGRRRYLVEDEHGIALLETDPAVLAAWPRGGMDHSSAEEGSPGRAFVYPDLLPDLDKEPLTTERLAYSFGPSVEVVLIPEDKLPAALEHPGSRAHLTGVGFPASWQCGYASVDLLAPADMVPPTDDELRGTEVPDGIEPADLLAFAVSEFGRIYVHRRDGSVHIAASAADLGRRHQHGVLARLADDLDHFVRCLEAAYLEMSRSWHPYPDEGGGSGDICIAPGLDLLDPRSPAAVMWGCLLAGVTELSEDGY
ncbi:SUKH-4 family immunity protein [Streptomyces boluensis]|uniref:SUKH-4 immunity protein of toxin-antitoxin system n=1 Tax=Streptomyces boluensis TaxID=1775135 RepID=A0A964XKG3_9ACTN|nr:SUKH-4 family immunity protein [Streptomyces boluensis]NBE52210.1 hypothetical protein [Streptomyces boluensis]